MNADRLIADAKKEVLALAASGYVAPQQRTDILAMGEPALSTLKLGIHQMKRADTFRITTRRLGRSWRAS
jgi:3-hydroxyacyl-CoA dehydrogenase